MSNPRIGNRLIRLWAFLPAVVLQASFAAESGTAAKPSRVITNTVTAQAIVESVNPETREVKLIGADNRRFTVVVDAQVRNFDQIRPRDRLNVEYLESVAIDVLPAGTATAAPDPTGAAAVEVAPKGDKPGIKGVEVAEILATITSIDREARTATLLLSDGEARTVKVGEKARLDLVNVGDHVRVTTTHAIAIAVTPPKS